MARPLQISPEQLKSIISGYIEQSSDRMAEHIVYHILMQGISMNAIDDDVNDGCELIIRFSVPSTKECENIAMMIKD